MLLNYHNKCNCNGNNHSRYTVVQIVLRLNRSTYVKNCSSAIEIRVSIVLEWGYGRNVLYPSYHPVRHQPFHCRLTTGCRRSQPLSIAEFLYLSVSVCKLKKKPTNSITANDDSTQLWRFEFTKNIRVWDNKNAPIVWC